MSNQERTWLFNLQVNNANAIASIRAVIDELKALDYAYTTLNGRNLGGRAAPSEPSISPQLASVMQQDQESLRYNRFFSQIEAERLNREALALETRGFTRARLEPAVPATSMGAEFEPFGSSPNDIGGYEGSLGAGRLSPQQLGWLTRYKNLDAAKAAERERQRRLLEESRIGRSLIGRATVMGAEFPEEVRTYERQTFETPSSAMGSEFGDAFELYAQSDRDFAGINERVSGLRESLVKYNEAAQLAAQIEAKNQQILAIYQRVAAQRAAGDSLTSVTMTGDAYTRRLGPEDSPLFSPLSKRTGAAAESAAAFQVGGFEETDANWRNRLISRALGQNTESTLKSFEALAARGPTATFGGLPLGTSAFEPKKIEDFGVALGRVQQITKAMETGGLPTVFSPEPIKTAQGHLEGFNHSFERHIRTIAQAIIIWGAWQAAMETLREAISLMSQLEATSARVGFVLGQSAAQGKEFTDTITRTGAQYGLAPSQQGDAAIRIAQTTQNPAEQQKLAEDAAKLSLISGQKYGQSVDDLVRIQRAFNLSLSDTQRILNTVSTIYQNVPSDIATITNELEKLGPVAQTTGLSMEQIGLLASKTAQQSGASLSTVVSSFTRSQENLSNVSNQRVLERFGITPINAQGEVRPFLEVLREVKDKIDDLKAAGRDTDALDLARAVGGSRPENLRIFLSLLNNINTEMPKIASADDLVSRSLETLETKINKLTAAWQQFIRAFGNTGALKDTIDLLTKFLDHAAGGLNTANNNKGGPSGALAASLNSFNTFVGDALNRGAGILGLPGGISAEEFARRQAANRSNYFGTLGVPDPERPTGRERVSSRGEPDPLVNAANSQASSVASENQKLILYNILRAQQLQELNKTAISQDQANLIIQKSIERSKLEEQLWRERLTQMDILGDKQDEFIQKLKDQINGAAVELNVGGKPQLVTGPGAAYAQQFLPQVAPQVGFLRANIDPSQAGQLFEVYKRIHQQLVAAGLNEEAQPTVIGYGKDSLVKIQQSQLIYLQAMSLALAEIEKTQKQALNGVYNLPAGASAYVAYGGFQLDRQTRSNMGLPDFSQLASAFAPSTNSLNTSSNTYSNATIRFHEAVAEFGKSIKGGVAREGKAGSPPEGQSYPKSETPPTGSTGGGREGEAPKGWLDAVGRLIQQMQLYNQQLQSAGFGREGGASSKGDLNTLSAAIQTLPAATAGSLSASTLRVNVLNQPPSTPVTITNNNISNLLIDGRQVAQAVMSYVTTNLIGNLRTISGGGNFVP